MPAATLARGRRLRASPVRVGAEGAGSRAHTMEIPLGAHLAVELHISERGCVESHLSLHKAKRGSHADVLTSRIGTSRTWSVGPGM